MAKIKDIVDVTIRWVAPAEDDFCQGWTDGYFGQPIPEDATDSYRRAHAIGKARAEGRDPFTSETGGM